jgi:hypothetical protein
LYSFSLLPLVLFGLASAIRADEFKFKDGDRVALVGSTLIEREQKYGYWELALTTRHPDKNITFRNLGWSGDTVWGESRVGFDLDNAQKGFERLVNAVLAVKPTVIIVGYGTNESFAGEAGLPRFKEGLNKLLDAFAPTKARIVLLSPLEYEDSTPQLEDRDEPLLDTKKLNQNLSLYSEVIQATARKRGCQFIDLQIVVFPDSLSWIPSLRDNGMHLTEFGYWRYSPAIEKGLGYGDRDWRITIDVRSGESETEGSKLEKLDVAAMRFQATDTLLPEPWPHAGRRPQRMIAWEVGAIKRTEIIAPERWFRVGEMAPGKYQLKIDGKPVADGSAMDWSFGKKTIDRGPEFDQAEKLRQAIIEKNQLFFHRYRPQNETYLFGFRKYEQGNNAVEVPQFDALIEAKEKEIAKLRVPVKHTYELVPSK